jgi:hypothetical protein
MAIHAQPIRGPLMGFKGHFQMKAVNWRVAAGNSFAPPHARSNWLLVDGFGRQLFDVFQRWCGWLPGWDAIQTRSSRHRAGLDADGSNKLYDKITKLWVPYRMDYSCFCEMEHDASVQRGMARVGKHRNQFPGSVFGKHVQRKAVAPGKQ